MTPAIIQITPDPIAFSFGPLNIGWYGIAYVAALGALLYVTQKQVALRGFDPSHVGNAFLLVLPLAVIGGRLYHVIHEWGACGVGDPCYSQNLLRVVLPPYAGLGLYGGVAGGALAIFLYVRWKKLPVRIGLDAVIPGTFFAQAIARWGNFFNQELYGPPTNAPWGIAIDCAHRLPEWSCAQFPEATTGFHPLFFYESALDLGGALIALYLVRRYLPRIVPGDIAAFWGIWYGLNRAWLETFRSGWNWTLGGVATAQWIGIALAAICIVWIGYNHRPGRQRFAYMPPWQPPDAPPKPNADDEADYYAASEQHDVGAADDHADDADDAEVADDGYDMADPDAHHDDGASAQTKPDVSPAG